MQHNIYQEVQTVAEWQYTIKKKFSDVTIKKPQEIADILAITDAEEVKKIQQALLENYAEKHGLKGIEFKQLHESVPSRFQAEYQLEQIVEKLNQGWKPNWQDTIQKEWYPSFNLNTESFYGCSCYWGVAYSDVGPHLHFETEEQAWFMGNYYTDLYMTYLNG